MGEHYKEGRYLRVAPNLSKALYNSVMGQDEDEDSTVNFEDVVKISKKFQREKEKRKKARPPSIKEVRGMLRHMFAYSESKREKEFKSIFPILKSKQEKQREEEEGESDSGSEDEDKGENERGIKVLSKGDAKKFAKKLREKNENIPMFRK